jgi:predicted amidophosphoribosyltransferase
MARINPDGSLTVACSWCHTAVLVTALRNYCPTCGHRADVARVDCDCPKCWKPDDAKAEGR